MPEQHDQVFAALTDPLQGRPDDGTADPLAPEDRQNSAWPQRQRPCVVDVAPGEQDMAGDLPGRRGPDDGEVCQPGRRAGAQGVDQFSLVRRAEGLKVEVPDGSEIRPRFQRE
jgi:hypothetical protein